MGVTLNEAKTSIKHARQESFTYLGYTFGPHRYKKAGHWYLGASPSKKAVARIKEKVGNLRICSMIGGSSKAERKRVCWRPNRNAETFLIIFVRFLWTNRSGCFKLNWMSGKQTGINAVDQILQKVDLAGIQDERARECIRLLLNLIESLTADLRKAQAEILYLREQLNRRKGGGDKPNQPKDASRPASQSSEKERAETKPHTKR